MKILTEEVDRKRKIGTMLVRDMGMRAVESNGFERLPSV